MKTLLSFFLIMLFTINVFGQSSEVKKAHTILSNRSEVNIQFELPKTMSLSYITKFISIYNREQNTVYANVNRKELNDFLGFNIPFIINETHTAKGVASMASSLSAFMQSWGTYPTYSQYDSLMQKLANDYPNLCEYHVLGTLTSGHKILALRLGDNVTQQEKEPRFLYTSTMHGDELTGYVLMLRLANYLLSNYGQNALVDSLMNNVEIWINPLANPDGTYYIDDESVSGAIRRNDNHIDLNRNYPDPDDGAHPDGHPYQEETIIFMDFADSVAFNMSANLHGGAEVANYPWDTWSFMPADVLWWKYVCFEYADTAQANSNNGYFSGPSGAYGTGVINGYAWYPIYGGRQDYMNYYQHCREFTVELSNAKSPASSSLPYFWNANYRSLLNYMLQSHYGLQGVVTDSITNLPLKSKVYINTYDKDSSCVFSRKLYGDYYRYLDSGYYSVSYSAPHYYSKTFDSVRVDRGQVKILNVALVPDHTSIVSFVEKSFSVYPNPANEFMIINSKTSFNTLSLISLNGSIVKVLQTENSNTCRVDLKGVTSGVYIIKLEDNKGNASYQKIIIQ